MKLEDINKQYLDLQKKVETYKAMEVSEQNKLEQLLNQYEYSKRNYQSAKDKTVAKAKLDEVNAKIELKKSGLVFIKAQIDSDINQINEMIEAIKSNPEISLECEKALGIHVKRVVEKFSKQKEEQENKKATLEELKKIIDKHPMAKASANLIEAYSLKISKLEEEIKDIENKCKDLDPKDVSYIRYQQKLTNKKEKVQTLETDRVNERQNLKKTINNTKFNSIIDNLTTTSALDKSINNCNRLIKRSENKIKSYSTVAENQKLNEEPSNDSRNTTLDSEMPSPKTFDDDYVDISSSEPMPIKSTRWERFYNDMRNVFSKKKPGDPSRFVKFRQAIKNLFSRRETLETAEPAEPAEPADEKESSPVRESIEVEGNPMESEIVQDYYKGLKEQLRENTQQKPVEDKKVSDDKEPDEKVSDDIER